MVIAAKGRNERTNVVNRKKCNIVLGMINETKAKARLLLNRLDSGEEVTSEEVDKIEQDVANFMAEICIIERDE